MVYVQVGDMPTVHAETYGDFTYAESVSGGIAITGYSGSDTVLVIPSMIDGKAVKAPNKEGKGYEYPVIGHMVGLEGTIVGDRKKLLAMAGF